LGIPRTGGPWEGTFGSAQRMEIDYVIEFPCVPKRRLRSPGLLTLLRRIERFRSAEQPGKAEAAEAREADFRLRPLAFHCARCPANHAGGSFGCHGRLETPISAHAEEWLGDLLPASLTPREDTTFEQRCQIESVRDLLQYLSQHPVTGKLADARRGGEELLERKHPLTKRYGSLFRSRTVSTSQLLQLLLLGERLQPEPAELLCRALGAWVDGGDGDDGIPEVVFTMPLETDDDSSVADLKDFLHALIVACSLDAPVRLVLDDEPGV
jgi:hypothetical protein